MPEAEVERVGVIILPHSQRSIGRATIEARRDLLLVLLNRFSLAVLHRAS
jgi:hypothetical protein